jgi:hypothetical protein
MRANVARAEGLSYFGLKTESPFPYTVHAGDTDHRVPDMGTARRLALTLLDGPNKPIEVRITACEATRDEGEREGLVAIYRRD